jgi:5-methylcytosine-specific restriction endonuclease McrA
MADDSIPTSKVCTKCGEAKPLAGFQKKQSARDGLNSSCKPCENAAQRANKTPERNRELCRKWRSANIESAREADRARYPSRREERLVRGQRDWASMTPEQRAAKADAVREWKAANPGRVKAMWERTYAKHQPKHTARARRWRHKNPEATAASRDRRRARAVGAPGDYTKDDVRHLLKTQGRVCRYCDGQLTKFHVDHFIPLARGGSNGPENLVLACPSCNCSKGAKLPWEWMPERFPPPPKGGAHGGSIWQEWPP